MGLLVPIVITVITGIGTYIIAKGVSISKAAEEIDYEIKVKNFRVHSVSITPLSIDTRFSLDIKLINPTVEKFKISHPDIIIKYAGQEIGRSTIKNKIYELGARSEATIKDIEFKIDLAYLKKELKDFINTITGKWEIGKGIVYNISTANDTLSQYQEAILKHLAVKVNLTINKVPISYEDTLAGGRSFGKFVLGYAPISAVERNIKPCPEHDKYFPAPVGKRELVKKNASVFQTVSLMVDVVNKDHKLIRDAAYNIFKKPTVEKTARYIFDWIYNHIKYDIEVGEQLRNPVTTYHLGQRLARKHYKQKGFYNKDYTADCDDISIFIASILKNLNIPYLFRIADYTGDGYSHVYTLIPRKGKPPIIIDPVYHQYNSEKKFIREKTFDMNKKELSGIDVYYLSGIQSNFGDVADNTLEYLINSRNAIAANPNAYTHIASPVMLVEMYDYAIKYWNTPQRDTALAILESKEEELIAKGLIRADGIAGLKDSKFFKRLKEFREKRKEKREKRRQSREDGREPLPDIIIKEEEEELQKQKTEVDDANYAKEKDKDISSGDKSNLRESTRAFVAKYKWPIVGVTTLTAGGIAFAAYNKKRKKSQANG